LRGDPYSWARGADGLNAREPYSRAEWAGSLARAQKNARGWSGKSYIESVDVIEARVIPD
jgi:hypothetical protein